MNLRHLAHLKLQSLLDILSNQKVVYLEMEEKKKYIPKRFFDPSRFIFIFFILFYLEIAL